MRNWSACITLILFTSGLAVYAGCGSDAVGSSALDPDGGTDPASDSGPSEDPEKEPGDDGGTGGKDAGDDAGDEEAEPGPHIIGYLFSHEPEEDESTPTKATSYSASGGDITVTRTLKGNYTVKFEGLDLSDSVVLVTAYDLPGGHCFWRSTSGDEVKVRCTAAGNLTDSKFTLAVVSKDETTGATILGFAHAHDKEAKQYEPDTATSNNAVGGGAITATYVQTGEYEMEFGGLQMGDVESVQVKAYGDPLARCMVKSWGGPTVKTYCYDETGAPVDAEYTVLLLGKKPGGTARPVAYAHAEQGSGGAYNPALAFNSTAGSVTANRSGKGTYTIAFAGQNFDSGALAQAVSYSQGRHCIVTELAGVSAKLTCTLAIVPLDNVMEVDTQYAIVVFQ